MPAKKEGHEVIPSARRLIKSLRDMGYDFVQAVSDIVDNSIEAGASLVAIDVEFDGDDSWIRIADNGIGMNPEQLREAMRYGSERKYEEDDLGKFGLGLKTASMSQCQCLSVASRCSRNKAEICAYSWDLDHIEKTNKWEILPLERKGLASAIINPLKEGTGTVVLWQQLDRILGYRHPYGESARKRILHMCRDLELHLGMVFERFLLGEARKKRLKIMLNGNDVKPWDPFCQSEKKTRKLQAIKLNLEHEGVCGDVCLEPFILPHQNDYSSREAWKDAGGPADWNQQQGFYIYRAGRMIQSGGWSNLRAPDEHTKLARVRVSFSPILDEAFKINVAKMRAQMPVQIRESVRDAIGPVVKLAREIYDRKSAQSTTDSGGASEKVSQAAAGSATGSTHVSSTSFVTVDEPKKLTFNEWTKRVLAVAQSHEKAVIKVVVSRLKRG